MRKKVYYRYNPTTESYERVYPSRGERLWGLARNILQGFAIGAAILALLYICIDLPKEKALRKENEALRNKVEHLDNRLNTAITVMDNLAERDNNLYRVIMQIDPLTARQRFAGLTMFGTSDISNLPDDEKLAELTRKLELLERQVYVQSQSYDRLAEAINQNSDRIAHIPSIQPVSEEDMTQMASGYGWRVDPIYGNSKHHDGMDFAAPNGTSVYATGDGTVIEAGWNKGYGNAIDINHGYGYTTRFAHLSEILVKPGQKVKRGDLIGKVGNTGKSTGSHLHYEVRLKGVPQNPVNYYFQDLTPEEYARMVNDSENAGHVMD
ncbi:MAG: M23 family metallopeptidase [Bacteroidales bacterium]|nr:M23 family metallopeptidase [Bacteroidales bacterium]MBD5247495.1 M23 family metallopeptidase [Barnesiella sp.]